MAPLEGETVTPSVPKVVGARTAMRLELTPNTGSLNVTVNLMGPELVGSAEAACWLIVTVGGTLSKATLLSVLVEGAVALPAASPAAAAGIDATTVPVPLIPVTETV